MSTESSVELPGRKAAERTGQPDHLATQGAVFAHQACVAQVLLPWIHALKTAPVIASSKGPNTARAGGASSPWAPSGT
eukprot:5933843-Alexandrium_andersonii.AAC.1